MNRAAAKWQMREVAQVLSKCPLMSTIARTAEHNDGHVSTVRFQSVVNLTPVVICKQGSVVRRAFNCTATFYIIIEMCGVQKCGGRAVSRASAGSSKMLNVTTQSLIDLD